jgi:hypothetical protein
LVAGFIIYADDLFNAPASLWVSAVLMEPVGALFGYALAHSQGLSGRDSRTIAIETGVQSFTLTIAIITLSFEGQERDDVLLFPLLYGFMYIVNSSWIIVLLRYYVAPFDAPEDEGGDGDGGNVEDNGVPKNKEAYLNVNASDEPQPDKEKQQELVGVLKVQTLDTV